MFVRLKSVLVPAALLLAAGGEAHAQSALRLVAIQATAGDSTTRGVGILRPRYTGECFVVTPRHVAPPVSSANVRADGPRGNLDSLVSVPEKYSDDLASMQKGVCGSSSMARCRFARSAQVNGRISWRPYR